MPYNPSYTTYLFFCTKNNQNHGANQPTRERVPRPGAAASRGRRSAEPRRAPR